MSTGFYLKSVSAGTEISVDQDMSVGRADTSDIVLTVGHPSRNHARLLVVDGAIAIEDLGSSNGTFLNGNKLAANESQTLKAGDKLAFDIDEYIVEQVVEEDDDKTVLRAAVEEDKTMLRPAVEKAPEPQPAPVTPEPKPKTAPPVEPENTGAVRPGAWADPDASNTVEGRTQLLDKSKLQDLMGDGLSALDDLPEEVDCPSLIITSGSLTGTLFPLECADEGAWQIGSDASCDIVIPEGDVSGKHAKLTVTNGRWQLTDLMTVNGTFVNGKKSNLSYLDDGDRLTMGSVTALFRIPGAQKKVRSGSSASGDGSGSNSSVKIAALAFVVTLAVAAAAFFLL